VNIDQKSVLVSKIKAHFNGQLKGLTVALWGLSFKPNTDDMREAPSLTVINELLAAGATVRAYDPVATAEAQRALGVVAGVTFVDDAYEAATGADILVLVTEWQEFRSPDFDQLKILLKHPVIFDGRNIYNAELLARQGFSYYGIGRGQRA
jgi:UDPglucose 6-dehydrogenase